ncbi:MULTISPECIES: DUF4123 domain-containing protein [unclassified Pseudomonas]|uniref:DUF4123 domain-containing protein n=1 Tax=unclassified Pseudomonas TaxID=196821 RepID=UPI000A1E51F0|nr:MULTISPECIES: DUF4123 domain-containing protein [unclassified Pseudomonas]
MSGRSPEPQAQWLLLDAPLTPQVQATLRQGFAHQHQVWLFEATEFQPVREQGPLLVALAGSPALTALCHSDPQTWRGLLIGCEAPVERLLAHLRCMLTVSVGLHHRALFGFYNTQTASYFFDACDAAQLSCWLGPIRRLRWYGGSWADRALGSLGWQQLRNPGLAVTPLAVDQSLTALQQRRLRTCLLEQHAWRWSRALNADYAALWRYVQEGLGLGFSERAVLDGWLWLRLQHPRAPLVPPPAGLTPQQRLDHLHRLWQRDGP